MNEKELKKEIGKKIRFLRRKKGLTQKELGAKIGVENNTVSAYERGAASLSQDMLFKISRTLGVTVDDLFPEKENTTNELDRALQMAKDLDIKKMEFLNKLNEKTLSLEEDERKRFLESIKFTVDYYDKMNENK